MSSKWLELLKEIAPNVTRVAVLRDRDVSITETGEFAAIQAVASAGSRGKPDRNRRERG
jgi:putative tryptophan/tyrosine transport system substrate-binding protein